MENEKSKKDKLLEYLDSLDRIDSTKATNDCIWNYNKEGTYNIISWSLIFGIFIVLFGYFSDQHGHIESFFSVLILVFSAYYAMTAQRIQNRIMHDIAKKYGFAIEHYPKQPFPGYNDMPSFYINSPFLTLQSPTAQKRMRNLMTGIISDHPVRIFEYIQTVGDDYTIQFSICEIKHDHYFSDIFLDTRINRGKKLLTSLDHSLEKLELEGDFQKFFTLFVEKGSETKALQILTPDVMATLIDLNKNTKFSIEFNKNIIFIYANRIIKIEEEFAGFVEIAKYLIEKVVPKLERIHN